MSNRNISLLIYSFLIIGVVFIGSSIQIFQFIGQISILLLLFIALYFNVNKLVREKLLLKFQSWEMKLFIPLILWVTIYLMSLFRSSGYHDIYVVTQLILLISFVLFTYRQGTYLFPNRVFIILIVLVILGNLIVVLFQSNGNYFIPFRPDGLFDHRNSLATTAYYLLILLFLFYKKNGVRTNLLLLVPIAYLIYVANSRAIYITLLIFLFSYYYWEKISDKKFIYYIYIYSFLFINILFISVMIGLFDNIFPEASLLDLYFRQYTGGNLQSGRQLIWPGIIEQIGKNPLMGSGAGSIPSDFLNTDWSSHNYYLQLLLQTGILGFLAFMWFFTCVFFLFREKRQDPIIRVTACFLISILFHQTFVVSLTQNNMEQAVLFWFIIGLGLNRIRYLTFNSRSNKIITIKNFNEK